MFGGICTCLAVLVGVGQHCYLMICGDTSECVVTVCFE